MKQKLTLKRFLVTCSLLLLTGSYCFARYMVVPIEGGSTGGTTTGTGTGTGTSTGTGTGTGSSTPSYPPEYGLMQEASVYTQQAETQLKAAQQAIQGVPAISVTTYKEAMQKAEKKLAQAAELLGKVTGTAVQQKVANLVKQAQAEKKRLLQKVGDPVILSTGEYTESTNDLTITCNTLQFPLIRSYRTSNSITGSLGYGWISSLDQRLIPGVPSEAETTAEAIQSYLEELNSEVTQLTAGFRSTYGSDDYATAKQIVQANKNKAANGYAKALETSSTADKAISCYESARCSVPSGVLKKEWMPTFTNLMNSYNQALQSIDDDYAAITRRKQEIIRIQEEYGDYLNYKVPVTVFPGTPDYYYENGADTVTLITAAGTPVLFHEAGQNRWKAEEGTESAVWYTGLQLEPNGEWQLMLRNGTVQTFTAEGYLCREEDRNGNSVTLQRDGETSQVTAITTSNGETFSVAYTDRGFISTITSTRDDSWNISYTYSQNLLSSFTDADRFSTHFAYDSHHNLTAVQKADGSAIRFTLTYDDEGNAKVTATTNEEGISETFTYNDDELTAWFTDHDGNNTRFIFDSQGRTIQTDNAADGRCINQWSTDGKLISETRNGKTNRFHYSELGDLDKASYGDGTSEQWAWSAAGDLLCHQDTAGTVETYERDVRGNLILYRVNGTPTARYTYDRYGRMTRREQLVDTPMVTTYTWDAWGNMASSTVQNDQFSYEYDSRNRVTAILLNGQCIETRSYTDRVTTVSKENGLKSTFTLDDRKNLISVEHKDMVTGEVRTTAYLYDRQHNPLLETLNGIPRTACRYTGEGRPIARIRFDQAQSQVTCWTWAGDTITQYQVFSVTGAENETLLANPSSWQTVSLEYLMQLAAERNDLFINPAAVTTSKEENSLAGTSRDTYDSRGRLIRRLFGTTDDTAAAVYYEEYQYADKGRSITVTKGGKYPVLYRLNAFGEVISRTESNGKTTTFTLTEEGQPRSVTLPLGQTTSYVYDYGGNITRITQCDGSSISYGYTALGELTGITTAAGTQVISPGKTETGGDTQFFSETASDMVVQADVSPTLTDTSGITYNLIGNITRAVTDQTDLAFKWNQAGQLTEQKDLKTAITTTWSYDDTGRTSAVTMQRHGSVISKLVYRWDANGNLTSVQDTAQNLSVTCTYDGLNRETERKYGNGTAYHTRYDGAGRKSIIWTTGPQGNIINAEGILYDPTSGKKTASITHEGKLTIYTYTDKDQLESVTRTVTSGELSSPLTRMRVIPAETVSRLKKVMNSISPTLGNRVPTTAYLVTETYSYDDRGNRVSQVTAEGTTRYTYDEDNRLLYAVNESSGEKTWYTWDTEGNLTEKKSSTRLDRYTYDDRNRLTRVEITTNPASTPRTEEITYQYDALGRRYSTTTNGTTVYQVYDGVTFAVTGEVYDVSEKPKTRYRWDDASGKETGSRIRLYVNGNPAAEKRGTVATYLSTDSTGSVILETDQYGRKQTAYHYDPFGQLTSSLTQQYR